MFLFWWCKSIYYWNLKLIFLFLTFSFLVIWHVLFHMFPSIISCVCLASLTVTGLDWIGLYINVILCLLSAWTKLNETKGNTRGKTLSLARPRQEIGDLRWLNPSRLSLLYVFTNPAIIVPPLPILSPPHPPSPHFILFMLCQDLILLNLIWWVPNNPLQWVRLPHKDHLDFNVSKITLSDLSYPDPWRKFFEKHGHLSNIYDMQLTIKDGIMLVCTQNKTLPMKFKA